MVPDGDVASSEELVALRKAAERSKICPFFNYNPAFGVDSDSDGDDSEDEADDSDDGNRDGPPGRNKDAMLGKDVHDKDSGV